jgi:hypothetical protein
MGNYFVLNPHESKIPYNRHLPIKYDEANVVHTSVTTGKYTVKTISEETNFHTAIADYLKERTPSDTLDRLAYYTLHTHNIVRARTYVRTDVPEHLSKQVVTISFMRLVMMD